jgi:hypothetical protein
MLLFWSEEHVERWRQDWGLREGEVFALDVCWRLALAWYGEDRRPAGWRRKTVEEAQEVFSQRAEIGVLAASSHRAKAARRGTPGCQATL